jgi:Zn-dependent protease/predicted transcriptional regulator
MKNWSIAAGKIFGIQLRIHVGFVLLLLFVWFTDTVTTGTNGAVRGLALVAIVFSSVVAHELGHAILAVRYGLKVRSVVLLPIGGVTVMENQSQPDSDPGRELRIAAIGPIINLLLALVSGVVIAVFLPQAHLFERPYIVSNNLVRSFAWANLFLGAFNLLPAYPLDGGRVLRAWFAERMDQVTATRRAVGIGQSFAMLLIFAGIVWSAWLMLIGMFLFFGGMLEDRSAMFQAVTENVHMEDVMLTEFSTLSPADTLEHAVEKALHSLQDDFPVVRGTDMVGVISRQSIMENLRKEGNGYVQAAMVRIFHVADRKETLASALAKVGRAGISLIPVVEDESLVGIVTMQNLMHSMALLSESRKLRRAAE